MKHDILNRYRDFLNLTLNKNTANKYYFAVKGLLKERQFNHISQISVEFLENETSKIKNKNDFSAAKNGLLRLKEVYPELNIPSEDFFRSKSLKKRNWSKKPKNIIYLDETKRKINSLKNIKFKYAFRLALVSGLRVSELAELTKDDLEIDANRIKVTVRKGKGGSNGTVNCMEDKYLADSLMDYIKDKAEGEKLFYSASSMEKKAGSLGLQCHDFRRIAAINFRKSIIKEQGFNQANDSVKKMLRHKRFSTTKRYLFNKKLVIKRSRHEEEGK